MHDERRPTVRGAVVSIRGSVVDVRFETDLPPIYSLLAGFKSKAKRSASKVSMRAFTYSTTARSLERSMSRLASASCLSMRYGGKA